MSRERFPTFPESFDDLRHALDSDRFPAGLLLCGPRGVGLRALLLDIAQGLLCGAPRGLQGCGSCPDCRMFASGHPRLLWLLPQVSEEAAKKIAPFGPAEILEDPFLAAPPPPNAQVSIGGSDTRVPYPGMEAGVRGLVGRLALSEPRRRVVVVPFAEQLNQSSSNALLKTLEEPPPGVHFLLAAASPEKLLPTIRSRVVLRQVPLHRRPAIEGFLVARGLAPDDARALANECGGLPGLALRLSSPENRALLDRARTWIDLCLAGNPDMLFDWIAQSPDVHAAEREGEPQAVLDLLGFSLHCLHIYLLDSVPDPGAVDRLERLRKGVEDAIRSIEFHSKASMALCACALSLQNEAV